MAVQSSGTTGLDVVGNAVGNADGNDPGRAGKSSRKMLNSGTSGWDGDADGGNSCLGLFFTTSTYKMGYPSGVCKDSGDDNGDWKGGGGGGLGELSTSCWSSPVL